MPVCNFVFQVNLFMPQACCSLNLRNWYDAVFRENYSLLVDTIKNGYTDKKLDKC